MATRPSIRRKADVPDPFAVQPDLAPAPVAAAATQAANDAARTAIATINNQLGEFDRVAAGLADLERLYKGVVYPVDTPKGMSEATAARLAIRKPRYAVEDARKAAKAPILALGRDIDARAGQITAALQALEDPIDGQIKAEERKEAVRKADLEQRVADIVATPAKCIGKSSAQLQEVVDALDSLPIDSFQEYRERAAQAQFAALSDVRKLLQQARDSEEVARLRAEQAAQQQRRDALQARVDAIGELLALPYRTSARVQQAVDKLSALAIGDDWEEFAPAARERKAEVLARLAAKRDELAALEKAREVDLIVKTPATQPVIVFNGDPRDDPVVEDKTAGEPTDYSGQQQLREFIAGSDPQPGALPVDLSHTWEEVPAPTSSEVSIRMERPTDAEILGVVAAHYDVTWSEAARWLRGMDVQAALAQLPLEA